MWSRSALSRHQQKSDPPSSPVAGTHHPVRPRASLVVARTWHKLFEDRILGMAAEAGFWAIVSLPSLLLTLLGALGYLRGVLGDGDVNRIHDAVLRAARDVLTPSTVNSDVAPLVNQVLARGHLEVISVGFVISFWSGSTAMSDYVNTITVAYGMRGLRSAWRSRLVATGLYLCFLVVGVVLLPALALGPGLLSSLAPDQIADQVSTVVHILYWPVVGLLSILLLTSLYRMSLPVRGSLAARTARCGVGHGSVAAVQFHRAGLPDLELPSPFCLRVTGRPHRGPPFLLCHRSRRADRRGAQLRHRLPLTGAHDDCRPRALPARSGARPERLEGWRCRSPDGEDREADIPGELVLAARISVHLAGYEGDLAGLWVVAGPLPRVS